MLRFLLAAPLFTLVAACTGGSTDTTGDTEDTDTTAAPAHYAQAAGTATWIDACATGTDLAPTNPDENSVTIDISSFEFLFFGAPTDSLKASTNGWISFSDYLTDSAVRHDQGRATLPSEGAPNAAVYALWEDLDVDATDGLCSAMSGTAGSQTLTVQWNAKFTTNGGPSGDIGDLAFEVQLTEGTNGVQILWDTIDATGDAAGRLAGATIGIENEADLGTSHPGNEAETYEPVPASGDSTMFTPSAE